MVYVGTKSQDASVWYNNGLHCPLMEHLDALECVTMQADLGLYDKRASSLMSGHSSLLVSELSQNIH